jgi:hypothetical protein
MNINMIFADIFLHVSFVYIVSHLAQFLELLQNDYFEGFLIKL